MDEHKVTPKDISTAWKKLWVNRRTYPELIKKLIMVADCPRPLAVRAVNDALEKGGIVLLSTGQLQLRSDLERRLGGGTPEQGET